MPRTSFVLPVKNNEQTLEAAIESVLAQTDPDFELLVINDGSTDRTSEIAHDFANTDRRVRVFDEPWRGIVGSLNFGLFHASGTYIARMDGDDITLPERLAYQVPALEADPSLGVIDTQVEMFRDDSAVPEGMQAYTEWINRLITPTDFNRELLIDSPIIHPAATFRAADIRILGGYRDISHPEDYDLWLRYHLAGFKLGKIPVVLHRMRDRPERLTRTDPRYSKMALRNARKMWLSATLLPRTQRIIVWGAGKEGRFWVRWLQELGQEIPAVVDIAAKRIGNKLGDVPIISPQMLTQWEADFCLVAVGARGAREEIRKELARLRPDWIEGIHWLALR